MGGSMSTFVTQTVSDAPQILLVALPGQLRQELLAFLMRHEFEVVVHSPTQALDSELLEIEWYKIICLHHFSEKHISYQPYSNVLKPLQRLKTPVVLIQPVARQWQALGEDTVIDTWLEKEQDRRRLRSWFQEHFQVLSVFLGEDVVFDKTTEWWPFEWLIHGLTSNVVYDPVIDLHLVSWTGFLQQIERSLLKPEKHQYLVFRGRKQLSTAVVEEIKRQYTHIFGSDITIKKRPIKVDESELFEGYQVIEAQKETIPSLLTPVVQLLGHTSKKGSPADTSQGQLHQKVVFRPNSLHAQSVQKPASPPLPPRIVLPETSLEKDDDKREKIDKSINIEGVGGDDDQASAPNIDQKIANLFSTQRVEQKVKRLTSLATNTKKITKRNKKRTALFYGGLAIVGAGLGSLVLAVLFLLSQGWLENDVYAAFESETTVVPEKLIRSTNLVRAQVETYGILLPESFFEESLSLLAVSDELQETITSFQQIEVAQNSQLLYVLGDTSQTQVSPPSGIQPLYEQSSRFQSRLEAYLDDDLDPHQRESLSVFIENLEKKREGLIIYQQISPLLDTLLGQEQKRTYAVLFQNNQELRATGGFIQAVGIITVDKGTIIDTQVFSSYELDNQFNGAVTPPSDLAQVLGEDRLYLRDSNWNPDFPKTAEQVAWFLQQQLNESVDGVIGITLPAVQDILSATGPLDLQQYNELLTDKNIEERMEFHSEVTLVDSDQSSDYAVVVFEALLNKMARLPKESATKLADAIVTQANQKNIVMALTDGNEQATISLLGWSGELLVPNCPPQFSSAGCVVDSLGVFDSNVGINKANYHTKRSESHQISLSPTRAAHTHTLVLTNTSQSNAWPKGTYESYLRFVVPSNAQLESITVDGVALSADRLFTDRLEKQAVVGFTTSTPIQDETTVVMKYSVPVVIDDGGSFTFFYQKQPGIDQALTNLTLTHSPEMKPTVIAPQANVSGSTISFTDLPEGHIFVGSKFGL